MAILSGNAAFTVIIASRAALSAIASLIVFGQNWGSNMKSETIALIIAGLFIGIVFALAF